MTDRSTRSNRVIHAILLTLLLIAGLIATGVVAAMRPDAILAADSCVGTSPESGKIYVEKYSTQVESGNTTFDYVGGESESVLLEPCQGYGTMGGGSFILLANIQDDSTIGSNPNIVQIGYGKKNAESPKRFYYTPGGHGVPVLWPGDLIPEGSHKYRASITRVTISGVVKAKYRITDLGTSEYEIYYGTWHGGYDHAWWGAETLDTGAQLGAKDDEYLDLTRMKYRVSGSSTIWSRSNMSTSQIKVQEPVGSAESWQLYTMYYQDDTINIYNN